MTRIEPEHPLELEYVIRVVAYGKKRKVRGDIGRALAKVAWLKFGPKATVISGKRIYRWDPTVHAGGTPEDILIEDAGEQEKNPLSGVDSSNPLDVV